MFWLCFFFIFLSEQLGKESVQLVRVISGPSMHWALVQFFFVEFRIGLRENFP